MRVRLVDWHDIGPEVRHFEFEVPGIQQLEFIPGQFMSLFDELNGKKVTRAYSIASQPDGNRFELSLNRVKEGIFSPHLFELRTGDSIQVKGPYGAFTLKTPPNDSLFLATGTGVAPFRSMLHARLPVDSESQFTLLFGVRFEESLLYKTEFEELQQRYSNFRFEPTLTRPRETWTGRRGRVQTHLEELIGSRRDLDVYICGLKEMVNEVRDGLLRMGFDRKQVHYERYD